MAWKPAQPEDAATVILVRDGEEGLEAYMTRRHDSLEFLGGYHVFPGGKVDREDRLANAARLSPSLTAEEAVKRMAGVDDPARAFGFFAAAARELFEEAGVLLAGDSKGARLEELPQGPARELISLRRLLQADEIPLAEVLERTGLCLSLAKLLWFAHWITPSTSPRRFNTHFFVARCPGGQTVSPFQAEISEAVWIPPKKALREWKAGRWKMIPPTFASLDTLALYDDWEGLKADFAKPPAEHPRTVWKGF